jgi:7-keto-8-aminopelargonate synthetase-like enzyme
MTPSASATLIKTLELIDTDPTRRKSLHENSKYVREKFTEMGYDIVGSQTQIVPILIGDENKAIAFSRKIFELGVFGPSVRWPAVDKKKARIRFTIMATHTKDHLNQLVEACREAGKELKLI